MNYLTVTQTLVCAFALASPLAAADDAQLLTEFLKIKPDVAEVSVIAEKPLVVAVTGKQGTGETAADWARGELLGVFAQRGEKMVPISIQPNQEFPTEVSIEREEPDSITFGLADPGGPLAMNLKLFFDPKTYFPKRIVRFAPVRVRRVGATIDTIQLVGSDGKTDFTVQKRNGIWGHVTARPAAPPVITPPLSSVAQLTPMPTSTIGQFEETRPERARHIPDETPMQVDEKVGPYERVEKKIWIGKTFDDADGSVGIGDVGYFDEVSKEWVFLHIPEMADWSASAMLVEPDTIWVGLVGNGEGAAEAGGLLHYDRTSHQAIVIDAEDVIDKIVRVRPNIIYCGTSSGFTVMENDHVQSFEFTQQLDGSYAITSAVTPEP